MFRPIFAVVLIVGTLVTSGCRKKEQCAAGDSPAVCEAFQECAAVQRRDCDMPPG